MGIFSKRWTQVNSNEFEKLIMKIHELRTEFITFQSGIENLRSELETLRTNQNSLRGLVNKKLSGDQDEERKGLNLGFPFNLGGTGDRPLPTN